MATKNYSQRLSTFKQEIDNADLKDSLDSLRQYLSKRNLKILCWDEKNIAISLKVQVDLPPLGNFEQIDIRNIEPILVVINLVGYPFIPPKVYPDRLNFPRAQLPHLYIAKKDMPPAFCLVRGDLAEWYSNKQLRDLIIRVENWLRDASAGLLSVDGNQFDPTRIEVAKGINIYDYAQVAKVINNKAAFSQGQNFAIGLFERNLFNEIYSFKLSKIITQDTVAEIFIDYMKEAKKDNSLASKKFYHIGYIVWSETELTFNKYSADLPETWNELKTFCSQYDVDLTKLEKHLAKEDLNIYKAIPIIIGVKRPNTIIGFSDSIEFFNFYIEIDSPDVEEERIIINIPVSVQIQHQPLSISKAKEVSGFYAELGRIAIVAGCGALGSKIIMHLARSGSTNLILSDPDKFSPHNLIRNALFSNSEGINKAIALKKEIRNLYPFEILDSLEALPLTIESVLNEESTKNCDWIFDFTATNSFSQGIVRAKLAKGIRICKGYFSDFGNFGVLFFEGDNRNPRIDDLEIMLYAQYKELPIIASWLQREQEAIQKTINTNIGIGCNSETIILADDVVSLHAAYFSGVIRNESKLVASKNGKIFLNKIQHEPFFSNSPIFLEVPELYVIESINDPSWQIRLKTGIIEQMKKEMGLAMPNETGGIIIGRANYKTKTIHIVELLDAPNDSRYSPGSFLRGIQDLPETIQEINDQSGTQLGYIGEWHSHPFGPNKLSSVDLKTIHKIKEDFENRQTNIPVFIIVVTPTDLLPFVF